MSGGMALLDLAAAFSLKKTHTCCCLGPCCLDCCRPATESAGEQASSAAGARAAAECFQQMVSGQAELLHALEGCSGACAEYALALLSGRTPDEEARSFAALLQQQQQQQQQSVSLAFGGRGVAEWVTALLVILGLTLVAVLVLKCQRMTRCLGARARTRSCCPGTRKRL
jgi:hypothetical protein